MYIRMYYCTAPNHLKMCATVCAFISVHCLIGWNTDEEWVPPHTLMYRPTHGCTAPDHSQICTTIFRLVPFVTSQPRLPPAVLLIAREKSKVICNYSLPIPPSFLEAQVLCQFRHKSNIIRCLLYM